MLSFIKIRCINIHNFDKITRIAIVRKTDLPEIDEIVFAVSEAPLGEGAEAQVFKIHTNPNFTVRKRLTDMPINELAAHLRRTKLCADGGLFQPSETAGRRRTGADG